MPFQDKKSSRNSQKLNSTSSKGKLTDHTHQLQQPSEEPFRHYRVEGMNRRGVRYVKIIGRPGEWYISGIDGMKKEIHRVDARTIDDVLRISGRRVIGFQPICVRELSEHKERY